LQNIWIKICGITRAEDAFSAAELGADAIGLMFYPASTRAVRVENLPEIVGRLKSAVLVVAVFVDADREEIQAVIDTGLVDLLQFHGKEPVEFCESFSLPYMKAFSVTSDNDLHSEIKSYASAEYILLDSFDPTVSGGTGRTFDWNLIEGVARDLGTKLVLAGGLNPDNIRTAVKTVQPYGVDVSSGVEADKGIKDVKKMRLFIEGARISG